MTSNDLVYKNVQNELKNGIFDKKKGLWTSKSLCIVIKKSLKGPKGTLDISLEMQRCEV